MAQTALTVTLAVAWLALAVKLGLDLAGRTRERTGYPWLLASALIMVAGTLALQILDDLHRPFAERHVVARIALLLAVPSVALLVTGMTIKGRPRSAD